MADTARMASREAELAQTAYEAFQRHDIEAFIDVMHDDVVFLPMLRDADGQKVHRGHDAVRAYYASVFEAFPDYSIDMEELEAFDGALLIAIRVTGTGAASGIRLERLTWQASWLRGEKVAWWGFFDSREEALARLREQGVIS